MTHIEGTFEGAGGLYLYYQGWLPEGQVKAIIAIVHGLGAHSGLFDTAVQYLIPHGYAIYAFDLRGHGRSPGQRGHINAWTEFREDLHTFLTRIQERAINCACFVWGHSLGAVIALDYALHFPESLQGLILTAPALGKVRVPAFKVALGLMLSQIWPRFSLKVGIKRGSSSRDPKVLTAYAQDPLRHEYGSARLATEFFAAKNWVESHASDLKVPLLILHGCEDLITPTEGSLALFEQVSFPDKECHVYPGDYHDLHLDLNYQDVLVDLGNWLERHLNGGTNHQPAACQIKVASLQPENMNIQLYFCEKDTKVDLDPRHDLN
ncbi:lysophospholipase [Chlorogloeopsis sp. ULAP01]|uniref:alpha/beta hydrolase n=1 Tax=Chlorogloeopsis sp. ULAP01 TaxID=3056483 RepID=UPI0025AAEA6E|nr:alpha/beta hydrolase [Chlorogloeopsis sp. ULAP01]MDM9382154.1 lysophospholipase [Chlorogloeopsis sp. ULAP01]